MDLKDILLPDLKNNKYEIRDKNNILIAYLSMITEEDLDDHAVIEKITIWREKYLECFLSKFQPTIQRTHNWLRNILIPDHNRVLFKILTVEGRFVGHIGAIKRDDYIEYDYYIKGEKVEIKDFSLTLAKRFLFWICESTGINVIKGNVRSDNKNAMDFHLRTGFKINRKLPLCKKFKTQFEYNLIVSVDNTDIEPDLFLNEILLHKEDIKL